MQINALFNIDPKVWGPSTWATLHFLALKADAFQEHDSFQKYVEILSTLLPCESCRNDFQMWLKVHPTPSVGSTFEWTVDLHNHVNKKLGKGLLSYAEARSAWASDLCSYKCSISKEPTNLSTNLIILTSLVVILAVFVWFRRPSKALNSNANT